MVVEEQVWPRSSRAGPGNRPDVPITVGRMVSGPARLLCPDDDIHFEGALRSLVDEPGSTVGSMSQELLAADVAAANLEGPVTTSTTRAPKELEEPDNRYWFGGPPAAIEVLT